MIIATTIKTGARLSSFSVSAFLVLLACMFTACGNAGTSSIPASASGSSPATTTVSTASNNSGKTSSNGASSGIISAKAAGPFTSIRMLDQMHGWALSKSAVFKTADGGLHWLNVSPSNVASPRSNSIPQGSVGAFMDGLHAWIASVIQPEVSNSINIQRTSDGGKSWQLSTINDPATQVFDPPHFVNAQTGWLETIDYGGPGAGNESAAIFGTKDGGQTWSKLVSTGHGFNLGGFKTGISFKDARNGWATGYNASFKALLYVTHDGGQTWQPQTLSGLPGSIGTQATFMNFQTSPPVFFGNYGLLPVRFNGQIEANKPLHGFFFLTTTDGGQTWFSDWKTELNALTTFSSANLYIATSQNAWASDDQTGTIYATTNGGKSWQKVSDSIGSIKAFSFIDSVHGWAITG